MKNKSIFSYIPLILILSLLIIFPCVGSDGVIKLGENSMDNQARLFCWNLDGTQFGICNENGLVAKNPCKFWLTSDYDENYANEYQDFNFNDGSDELLDINWCPWNENYIALAGGINGEVEIWNVSNNPWTHITSLANGGKSHTIEWHPNQRYLIGEYLVDPLDSRLRIWNCSDADPTNWGVARTLGSSDQTDMFEMDVNGEKNLLVYESNENGYTNYKVHVWNISDTDCDNWGEIANSPITGERGGFFSPDGNFIINTQNDLDGFYIHYTSNLSLYRTLPYGFTARFHPDVIETENELISGYIVTGNRSGQDILVYNISNNYNFDEYDIGMDTRYVIPSPCGQYLGVSEGWVSDDKFAVFDFNYTSTDENDIEFISIENQGNGTSIFTDTPTINWTFVTNASQYWLQIDNNADFSSPILNYTDINEYNYPVNCNINATVSFTLPDSLPSYAIYYIRVRAYSR